MAQTFPAIPAPSANPTSLRTTSNSLKESVEILTRQRGDRSLSAVTWQDLLALGLITADQIPRTPTASGG
jgi:hypothetical protein